MRLIGSDASYKGESCIIYSSEETAHLAARLKFMLVGKFSHGLPNLNFLRFRIVKLSLKGNVTVGRLNFKRVLIHLTNEEDLSRLWLRGEWIFDSFHMRVFKWTPNFDPQIESSIASVWIRLSELPVHLFEKNALFTLAAKIGKPLRMDEPMADLSSPNANAVVFFPSHVLEHEQAALGTNRLDHVEVATHDDFNYEDPLLAELLDRDWDAINTSRNMSHSTNIDVVEGIHNGSEQDAHIPEVPNSQSEETPPRAAGIIRRFFRGETNKQRNKRDQSQEHPSPEAQTVSLDSEGEEEPTPISNHFQSLEDMETEEILQHIESMQNTKLPTKGMEAERGVENAHTSENKTTTETLIQEGEATEQEIIFTNSNLSNKHKRNKSVEGISAKSSKTGGKGRKGKCNIAPKLLTRRKTRSSFSSPHF
ncbi:UNVERIFIED_CONTAM: hypothetical protein Slati_2427800 [Sesamum latifolium]|uniref:DUF4283 domain-containing protein n=1 Tax=Sesamum latifolium TaxID=2727402 RepID=A0AAW2WCV8_9LAMI